MARRRNTRSRPKARRRKRRGGLSLSGLGGTQAQHRWTSLQDYDLATNEAKRAAAKAQKGMCVEANSMLRKAHAHMQLAEEHDSWALRSHMTVTDQRKANFTEARASKAVATANRAFTKSCRIIKKIGKKR